MIRDFTPSLIPWWVRLIIALAVIAILIGIGWTFRGFLADRDLAQLREQKANEKAVQAAGALVELSRASTVVNNAAMDAAHAVEALDPVITAISKERKAYVQAHPLPADCRPDAVRVQKLNTAIDAANATISAAGQ